jgi:hypothetical protein
MNDNASPPKPSSTGTERAARYRQTAAKLREIAERAATHDIRNRLLGIAEQYESLADRVQFRAR